MDIRYDEYLAKGTEKILEIFSSSDVSEGEREAIIKAFSDELISNIGDTNKLRDYEHLIYSVSIMYLDDYLSRIFSSSQVTYSDYEKAIINCAREKDILQVFEMKKWPLPELVNADLDKSASILISRQESTSISSKIVDEDRKIDELVRTAKKDLSTKTCDLITSLLSELDNDIDICKRKKLSVPTINNKDIKKISKQIADIRKIAEQKEALHQDMYELDLQIHDILCMPKSTTTQWEELVASCQRQAALILECSKKQWPMASLRYTNVNKIIRQYTHYLRMCELDRAISANRSILTSNKQYKIFFDNCNQLESCILTCSQNDWEIPELDNIDPMDVYGDVLEEKNRKDYRKRIKQRIYLVMVGIIAVIILVAIGVSKYRQGKVQIPFDSTYVQGEELASIYSELDDAGFKNIQKNPDYSGWLEGNEVISVSIDNQREFSKDSYKNPDVSVVITYSSDDRVYVTEMLKDWKTAEYASLVNALRDAGFSNISLNEIDTPDKEKDKITASIKLNSIDYTNEHCYIPKDAPIEISYYVLKIGIGNSNAQFVGMDYMSVVSDLVDSGFTNVKTEGISTGWEKKNSIIGVTVNNSESYGSSDTFDPGVKIVVKYSSGDRIDLTKLFSNWSTKTYSTLQSGLKSYGFTNVSVREKTTDNKSLNQLAASITINSQQFDQGDCFIQKNTPVVIEYYLLQIAVGHDESYFTSNTEGYYSSVVTQLRNMGFSNITVYRNDDLINGWITKEGSIESISFGGKNSFNDTDSFRYDVPVVIVVNTKKGEGCDDITLIQK